MCHEECSAPASLQACGRVSPTSSFRTRTSFTTDQESAMGVLLSASGFARGCCPVTWAPYVLAMFASGVRADVRFRSSSFALNSAALSCLPRFRLSLCRACLINTETTTRNRRYFCPSTKTRSNNCRRRSHINMSTINWGRSTVDAGISPESYIQTSCYAGPRDEDARVCFSSSGECSFLPRETGTIEPFNIEGEPPTTIVGDPEIDEANILEAQELLKTLAQSIVNLLAKIGTVQTHIASSSPHLKYYPPDALL